MILLCDNNGTTYLLLLVIHCVSAFYCTSMEARSRWHTEFDKHITHQLHTIGLQSMHSMIYSNMFNQE